SRSSPTMVVRQLTRAWTHSTGNTSPTAFLNELQAAIATRERLADMVSYPPSVRLRGPRRPPAGAPHFFAHCEQLLSAPVCAAIARQFYATLFANSQGVMIGSGEVWFAAVCHDQACGAHPVKTIAINP